MQSDGRASCLSSCATPLPGEVGTPRSQEAGAGTPARPISRELSGVTYLSATKLRDEQLARRREPKGAWHCEMTSLNESRAVTLSTERRRDLLPGEHPIHPYETTSQTLKPKRKTVHI